MTIASELGIVQFGLFLGLEKFPGAENSSIVSDAGLINRPLSCNVLILLLTKVWGSMMLKTNQLREFCNASDSSHKSKH